MKFRFAFIFFIYQVKKDYFCFPLIFIRYLFILFSILILSTQLIYRIVLFTAICVFDEGSLPRSDSFYVKNGTCFGFRLFTRYDFRLITFKHKINKKNIKKIFFRFFIRSLFRFRQQHGQQKGN